VSRTINELNTTDTLADADKFVIWQNTSQATRAITAVDMAEYFGAEPGGPFQPLDELLTAIAAQGPNTANGDFIQLTGQDTVRVRKLTVATYAALTIIPASFRFDDMLVYVSSRATDGDGGDGWWRFDAASSATANGQTVLAPDAGTGRWIKIRVFREQLSAAKNYYVRTDGSDSNTGLANTAGGAFLTLQKAVDVIWQTLDLNGFDVTINIGNGTYTAGALMSGPQFGEGLVYFIGDVSTPANVVISVTGGDCFASLYGARYAVRGVKMQTTTSGHCLKAYLASFASFQSVEFGASAEMHVECGQGSTIIADGAYTINGGAMAHFHCGSFGLITSGTLIVTLTGTPAFSSYFAGAAQGGIIITGLTFTGSATGPRYLSHRGGVISAAAVDPALPGDTAGRVATGGVYRASVVNPFAIMPDTGTNDSVVLYSRNSSSGAYTPRVDVRNDAGSNAYFYFNGDGSFSSGVTHLGSATAVVPVSGSQDGATFLSATNLAAGFYVFSMSANAAAVGYMRRRTDAGDILVFTNDNTVSGSVSVNGATAAYNLSSDKRLKNDLGLLNVNDALQKILDLKVHHFEWNHVEAPPTVGLFAQETHAVLPAMIQPGDARPDARPGDPDFKLWQLDNSKAVPYLIAAIQSLEARIAILEGA
jgi:hypothetical protein